MNTYLKVKQISPSKTNNRNLGIELLRAISCFCVILSHCLGNSNRIGNYIKSKKYHVPCFFMISFYFLYPIICSKNIELMKRRLERLLMPYIFWILIIWIINQSTFIFSKNRIVFALTNLKEQIIIGRRFMGHLWFMFNLIFFTIIFFILSFFLEMNNYLFILQIASIISYILQYSGIFYKIIKNFGNPIRFSVGYFPETIPFASSAFLLSYFNLAGRLKCKKQKVLIIIFFYLFLIIKYNIFSKAYGFNFQGIDKNIISIFLFIAFYLIPFEYLKPKFLYNFIFACTRFTQGIYYLHLFLAYRISFIMKLKGSFLDCFIIYITGYFTSFIGSKIAGKSKLKYLF